MLLFWLLFIVVPLAKTNAKSRIIGGSLAKKTQFAYQVSIMNSEEDHLCSGTIVNVRSVLTAAKCFVESTAAQHYLIVAGTPNLLVGGDIYNPEHIHIVNKKLAVVKIATRFEFSFHIQPIELNTDLHIPDGSRVRLSGWGSTSDVKGPVSIELKYLKGRLITGDHCNISEELLCLQTVSSKAFCSGDMGGPVTTNEDDKLVGILPAIDGKCKTGFMDEIINVAYYIDEIMPYLEQND